jgi:group I intron endonuclease
MIKIYTYTNNINGKVYIGKSKDLLERDKQHSNYGQKCMPIDNAIKKYGRENFLLTEITEVDTKEQADYAEIDWIARARSILGKENVYNITDGGDGFSGEHTEETKQKMSLSHIGLNTWSKGRERPIKDRNKISKSLIGNKRALGSKGQPSNKHGLGNKGNLGRTWKKINGIRVYSEKK